MYSHSKLVGCADGDELCIARIRSGKHPILEDPEIRSLRDWRREDLRKCGTWRSLSESGGTELDGGGHVA